MFAIPKLQYKNFDKTGDTTALSDTIANLDTSNLEVGMFVRGAGIPVGALIGSIGAASIVLGNGLEASATASGVDLEFGFEILFDYPPKESGGEQLKTSATVSTSLSGLQQVAVNHVEGIRKLTFSFLAQTLYAQLQTFLTTHGVFGNEFKYFEDKTVNTFVYYELEKLDVSAKKIAAKGIDVYVWEVPLEFRRVL